MIEETIIRNLESDFQKDLRREIEALLPGCLTFKQDSSQLQGIPDILIIHRDKWAMLEVKRSANERRQPNQQYYIDQFDSWSYAAFVYPENKEAILEELQQALRPRRSPRNT